MDPESLIKIRILLVEDDDDFCYALIPRLTKRGFDVSRVVSAEEALERVKDYNFDGIVADIKLPGINGIGFLAKVREYNKALPVVLITGYASLETAREAVRLDAAAYILKPLESIEDLLNPLYKATYGYRLVLENSRLINDLRAKLNELKKSERKYKNLFEAASDIIYTVTPDGIITSANKKVEKVTKYKREELMGKPVAELISPINDRMYQRKIQKILAGRLINEAEDVRIIMKDGRERLGEIGMRPIEEGGKITGIQCIVRDITERKQAEEKIRRAAEEWRATFDSITELVSIVDRNLRLIKVNKAFADTFGMKIKNIIGKTCHEVFRGVKHPYPLCSHQETMETQKPVTEEFFEPSLGVYLEVSTAPLIDKNGEIIGTVNIAKPKTSQNEKN